MCFHLFIAHKDLSNYLAVQSFNMMKVISETCVVSTKLDINSFITFLFLLDATSVFDMERHSSLYRQLFLPGVSGSVKIPP